MSDSETHEIDVDARFSASSLELKATTLETTGKLGPML
jgi:hypothetical protein